MIEETVLDNNIIKDLLKKKYNIKVEKVEKLNRGSANIYSLNDNTYVLKEFQSKYTKEEIIKEINVINHLRKDKLSVPEYIPTIDGNYYITYKGKTIILQKYIDGYTIESNTASQEQMLESSRELGKIVKSLKSLKYKLPINDVSSWYSVETINEGIEKHKDLIKMANGEYKDKIIKDLTEKIEMMEYVKENVDLSDMDKLTILNTHGDYSILQFIYKDEKINAIIDFVSACKMPVVWEVIRSYSYIDKKAKDGKININNLIAYVKEFNKYVKINKYDVKYMTYLYMIQILTSTYGYKQYIKDNSKISLLDFGFFRTNLCRHLFKNAEKIAKELEKEIL